MKYIDRDNLRNMLKEVTGAEFIKDYGYGMKYKKYGELHDMLHIYETKEEKDLCDKYLQEELLVKELLEKKLTKEYEIAKKENDRETMHYIEDRDYDYIYYKEKIIRKHENILQKTEERMDKIFKELEPKTTEWDKKDGEIYFVTMVEGEKDSKCVQVLAATINKDLAKEVLNKFNHGKELQIEYAAENGHKLNNLEDYMIIKYSDLIHEHNKILSNTF